MCIRDRAEAVCGQASPEAFLATLRAENSAALRVGAQKLTTGYTFEDLVVGPACERQLRDLCAMARVRSAVYGEWGFGKKSPLGRGVTALFYGAPGTGKTMAAGVVANELGLELYRVDPVSYTHLPPGRFPPRHKSPKTPATWSRGRCPAKT